MDGGPTDVCISTGSGKFTPRRVDVETDGEDVGRPVVLSACRIVLRLVNINNDDENKKTDTLKKSLISSGCLLQ